MGKVIQFTGITKLDLDTNAVLENLKAHNFEGFIWAGYDAEGNELMGSTYADGGTALWLLERCRAALLRSVDD